MADTSVSPAPGQLASGTAVVREIPLRDGECRLVEGFLEGEEATVLLERLASAVPWEQPVVTLFGSQVPSPRLAAWYGDPGAVYRYSGIVNRPRDWLPELADLRDRISGFADATFNSALLNYYRDGSDAMGWHADNESELGVNPVIASLSLGGVRRFRMRHRNREISPITLELAHGSLLLMAGSTQHHWTHAVPRTRRPVAPRVNLTFRYVYPD